MSETFLQRQNILCTGGDAAVFFSTVMMQIVTLSENFSLPGEIDWQMISERVLGFVLRLTADVDARARLSGVSGGRSWPRQPTTSPPVASSDVARLYAVQFALHNRVLFQAAPIGATVFSTRAIPLTPSGCWDGTIRQTLTPGAVVRLTRIQRPSDEVLALADTPNRQLITEAYAECETLPTTGSSRRRRARGNRYCAGALLPLLWLLSGACCLFAGASTFPATHDPHLDDDASWQHVVLGFLVFYGSFVWFVVSGPFSLCVGLLHVAGVG